MRVVSMRFQASRIPVAAEINVAVFLYEGYPQRSQGGDVVVEGGVRVPGGEEARAVGMQEGEGGRQVGVVVDYVGEVGHGFPAFVHWRCQGGGVRGIGGGVDGVDCCLPAVLFVSGVGGRCWIGDPRRTLAIGLLPSLCFPAPFWP